MNKYVFAIVASLSVFAGCDQVGSSSNKNLEPPQPSAADQSRAALTEYRKGMERLVEGKISILKEQLVQTELSLAEVRKDAAQLADISSAIAAEKDDKGEQLPREVQHLRVLQSPEVNALAMKYLSHDFHREEAAFKEAVRNARAAEKRYYDALRSSDENYEKNIKDSKDWLKATRGQIDEEIRRLHAEIKSLESRRKFLQEKWKGLSRGVLAGKATSDVEHRERVNSFRHELEDIDDEIEKKRYQLDALRRPDARRSAEGRAVATSQDRQRVADRLRESSLFDIERRLKPKKMLAEVIDEFEAKTITALQQSVTAKVDDGQKALATLNARQVQLKEAKLSVPLAEMDELRRLRKTLD